MSILASYMHNPLIAILRGVTEDEAVEVAEALVGEGFSMIEVPLNSPGACVSIRRINESYGDRALIGAGTVLTVEEVDAVHRSGGKLVVSPNFNRDVVVRSKERGMISVPGVATPTELFAAIDAGADAVKVFPVTMFPPATIRHWRTVMPADYPVFAVGGITPDNMAEYLDCGVTGFGIGGNLFKKGKSLAAVKSDAKEFIHSMSDK